MPIYILKFGIDHQSFISSPASFILSSVTKNRSVASIMTDQTQCLPGGGIPGQSANHYCDFYIPANATADSEALKTCCSPNPVQTYNGCGQWCLVPDRFLQNLTDPSLDSNVSASWVSGNFSLCVQAANPQHYVPTNFCNWPRSVGAGGGLGDQSWLMMFCLALCFSVFRR